MNDIDFDELDRAVSSALSSPADTSKPDQTPSSSAPTVPERAAQPPALRRSTGRFMDVVHPSSDMRTATTSPNKQPSEAPAAWPDPIDRAEQHPEPSTEQHALETPFLADAKVEKRPLGGPVPSSSLDDALAELNISEEAPVSLEGEPADAPTVETEDLDSITAFPAPELEDTEAEALGDTEAVVPELELESLNDTNEAVQADASQPSIIQQYTERPSSTQPEQSGAIFDTESYHQPVMHAHKKHSGWLIVLWILGLLVLGGGLGALAYFYLLPLL